MAPKSSLRVGILLVLSALVYVGLGYFTNRSDFSQLLFLFGVAFASYLWLLRQKLALKTGLLAAIGFRLLLLFAWPALSDDYFRFIWDGSLVAAGLNPFLKLPSQLLPDINLIPGLSTELFRNLNSPHYFSVYPPVCQFIFAFSVWISSGNTWGTILIMKVILLLAELGNIYLILRLLKYYQKPAHLVLVYALNPLVMVELTGNLHFEALLIFFTLASLYLFIHNKIKLAGVAFALAIAVKMLPLLFMPFFLFKLGWRKFIAFSTVIGVTLVIVFTPFLSAELFYNLGHSLGLYFQKFEFNASIYYLFRGLGYMLYGYNNIAQFGPFLSAVTFLGILFLAYKSRRIHDHLIPAFFLLALSIYFFLATTVHPWYLTTLVALAVFTPYRYAIIWSGAAILSYATYQTKTYQENLYLTALEYCLVWGWLIRELIIQRKLERIEPVN